MIYNALRLLNDYILRSGTMSILLELANCVHIYHSCDCSFWLHYSLLWVLIINQLHNIFRVGTYNAITCLQVDNVTLLVKLICLYRNKYIRINCTYEICTDVCLSSIMGKVPITGVYYTCDSLIIRNVAILLKYANLIPK